MDLAVPPIVIVIGDSVSLKIHRRCAGKSVAIVIDAVVLAELLKTNDSVETILENYVNRRYNRCKMVVDVSNTLAEWEQMEWKGIPLPEGANMGALMGKTLGALCAPI